MNPVRGARRAPRIFVEVHCRGGLYGRPSLRGTRRPRRAHLFTVSLSVNRFPLPGVYVSERGRESLLDPYIGQYGRRLYGLCRTLCRDPFDADDLYQETWLKALRHWDR